jgi:hypothetical protein
VKKIKPALLILAVMALVPLQAATIVVTFEGFENTIYGSPIVRDGYTIGNVAGDEQHFHEITSTNYGLPNNGTGILLNDRNTSIFVDAGGAGFYLDSVDVATATANNPAAGITISGYYLGGLTGSVSSPIDGNYLNLLGASLGLVDRIVFDGTGGGGGFVLDNLALSDTPGQTVVPEPGTALLLAGAFIAAGLARRRRLI